MATRAAKLALRGKALSDTGTEIGIVNNADATAITIDSNEKVGIGTASPTGNLSVNSSTVDSRITLTDSTTGANTSDGLLLQSGAANAYLWNYEAGNLIVGNNNAEAMRIDSSGNVLIKTATHTPTDTELVVSSEYNAAGTTTGGITLSSRQSGSWRNCGIFANGTDLTFTTGDTGLNGAQANSEKMRITNTGNVGIGTSSPSAKITIVGTTKVGEGVASNTSKLMVNTLSGTAAGIQLFQDGVESWIIDNPASSTALAFSNSGTERIRIDSSGNVLVGTTDLNPQSSSTESGTRIGDGFIFAGRAGEVAILNRQGSDGTIADFRKDGSNVGSIGSNGTRPYFASTNCGIRLGGADLLPATSTGVISDNVVSLGSLAGRWKDLYLSGDVITGGGGTNNTGEIQFVADSTRARIIGGYQSGGGGYLKFHTDTTGGSDIERMRIDSSGNVLVGTTTVSNAAKITVKGSATNVGLYAGTDATLGYTASVFERTASDGAITVFKKGGATVGSIGHAGGLYITGPACGLRFHTGGTKIFPTTTTGGAADGIVDLGASSARFKDAYLSGGVYLGGTGAANKLDDYETGTFTVTNGGGGETGVIGTEDGEYTKVGNLVTVRIAFTVTTNFISNLIGGLPFAPAGGTAASSVLGAVPVFTEGSGVNTFGRLQHNATTIRFYSTTSNNTHTPTTSLVVYRATLTYKTNA